MVISLETRRYEFWDKKALCQLYTNLVLSSFVPAYALCQLMHCVSLYIVSAYALCQLTRCNGNSKNSIGLVVAISKKSWS